ncbi:phosphoribosyl-ATP diphosphatase [Caulobacter sp. S45]|uniref:phosphoribosyl-ATP diphosphatase n=1 Tax=Caulobacter sp. S45 TaxID=1641861 RepID=UPI001C2CD4AB|nr:phosphoribosyl-ATP diphosphatase [Caulobacter sp. S45]
MAKPKAKSTPKRAPSKPRIPKPGADKIGALKARVAKARSTAGAVKPAAVKRPAVAAESSPSSSERLERLWAAIQQVRDGGRDSPRTARLLAAGPPKLAQKVVEEAAEVAIEAVTGKREALINESVDLIYNLVALWNGLGVEVSSVWAEMDRREAALGMAEKLPKTEDL